MGVPWALNAWRQGDGAGQVAGRSSNYGRSRRSSSGEPDDSLGRQWRQTVPTPPLTLVSHIREEQVAQRRVTPTVKCRAGRSDPRYLAYPRGITK
ncbi:hypothetical protein NDU88_009246 [Pleurodeles waltl]|uniref:Uncharacterized protein n=1 Tax=Pleurodeles waltl TaxID=8319 RepID=A0AAV7QR45_PLEWA|nr:hypothetical protein NDU88_009246 [Pleurodeles waltl]